MNGKGDAPRPVNLKVYRENFDAIDWQRESEPDGRIASSSPLRGEKSHLQFMRSMGFACKDEQDAYELRGLLDM